MVNQAGKSLCTNPQSFLYGVNTVLLPVQVGGMLTQLVSSSLTWPDFVASRGFSYTYIALWGGSVCVRAHVYMRVVRTLAPPVQSIYILLDL